MKLVDLNILIYAVNRDSPHHQVVRSWWEEAMSGDEKIGLAWVVVLGFLRLTTNPRVFPRPLRPEDSLDRVERWLNHSSATIVVERRDHWSTLRRLLESTGMAGNLTTDAHLAALAVTHGAVLVSCDADFGRFPDLRWENPLTARR